MNHRGQKPNFRKGHGVEDDDFTPKGKRSVAKAIQVVFECPEEVRPVEILENQEVWEESDT